MNYYKKVQKTTLHYCSKSTANSHIKCYMKFWSSNLRQDKSELESAHGKTAVIKGTALSKDGSTA